MYDQKGKSIALDSLVIVNYIICLNRIKPTLCRANDYDHGGILNRYLNFIQTLCKNVQIAANIRRIVEEETVAQDVRGILRLRPGKY